MTDFGLKLEPAERIVIANKKLGEEPTHTTLKITNSGKDRCAFKVKCTSNELFRIRPPLGILRNGDSTSVATHVKHTYIYYYQLIEVTSILF
uniref:MSP domain-containing protein n=1 Tax=Panagrolaimus superbus TaxID=310955 RepID=A0A914YQ56_9BILA